LIEIKEAKGLGGGKPQISSPINNNDIKTNEWPLGALHQNMTFMITLK
jgi:hypothetical protein